MNVALSSLHTNTPQDLKGLAQGRDVMLMISICVCCSLKALTMTALATWGQKPQRPHAQLMQWAPMGKLPLTHLQVQ